MKFAILDRPIAFHPIFVDWTGSINAALMLSQMVYWTNRTEDPDGWFWKTRDQWTEETRLSRREQESARESLKASGMVEERLSGNPARLYFRLTKTFEKAVSNGLKPVKSQLGGKRPTRRAESAQQDGRKAPNSYTHRVQAETTLESTEEKEGGLHPPEPPASSPLPAKEEKTEKAPEKEGIDPGDIHNPKWTGRGIERLRELDRKRLLARQRRKDREIVEL